MGKYARTLLELRANAVRSWPRELREREAEVSVLPLLLETHDKFISVLNFSDSTPDSWKKLIDVSDEFPANLFLKHLLVLSDLAPERLRTLPPLANYFPNATMSYVWRENTYEYSFKANTARLTSAALQVRGEHLLKGYPLNDRKEDVIMLLLHGATSINDTLPDDVKNKCVVGGFMGDPPELEKFVRQSYIRASRQMHGATANSLGQIAQDFVINALKERLPDWGFARNGTLPNVSHTGGRTDTHFDIAATSPNNKHFGIEVSFQVTTNSTIERKAGQAEARARMVHDAGHWICYVIDGAGNIDIRERAVETICSYSDCTVALSTAEIATLAEFMSDTAGL